MHLPSSFRKIPTSLSVTDKPSTVNELSAALNVRREFNLPGAPEPYLNDIVRVFRLAKGKKTYVEVGTRDKGNIAWLARDVLANDAVIVDIDVESYPGQERKLRASLQPKQQYHCLTGNSIDIATVNIVKKIVGDRGADVIFCDTLHTFQHTLSEFDAYYPILADGGVIIFHDCYFENNGSEPKGKSIGLAQVDRMVPVYAVFADEPTHRHLPRETNKPVWGGSAVIIKEKAA